jgi:hypothetical protein
MDAEFLREEKCDPSKQATLKILKYNASAESKRRRIQETGADASPSVSGLLKRFATFARLAISYRVDLVLCCSQASLYVKNAM